MNKFIIFCLALAACASASQPQISGSDVDQFFDGFSTSYGLHNQYEVLLTCLQHYAPSTLNSLRQVIVDLSHAHAKQAINDFLNFLQQLQQVKNVCPQAVNAYYQTFKVAIGAFISNKAVFAEQVAKDLNNDKVHALINTIKLALDVHNHKPFKAGTDFGALSKIALSAYLTPQKKFLAAVEEEEVEFIVQLNPSKQNAEDFFQGFASAFGLSEAANDLLTCANVDSTNFISHLQRIISDLKTKSWKSLVSDCVGLYGDIEALQTDCPNGAYPFIHEFGPAVQAFNADKASFMSHVLSNLEKNIWSVLAGTAKIIQDIRSNDYTEAGNVFGGILAVALNGYLPN